nr:uncharacterized protein LOC127328964 [Lolium perenne]
MAGKIPPPLPPIPPSAQSVAPPSLRSTSPTMAKLTPSLQQQIGEEVPAAGDVLGDPQLQVGGEPKMSSKIHGKLPKKIRKKKSIDACGELQRASDVRDSNEVTTSLPLSKKSAKKVIFLCYNKKSDKSPTAWTKRPLSEASGSSRAKKAAKLINAKVEMTQLQNKSKPNLQMLDRKTAMKNKEWWIILSLVPDVSDVN